MAHMSVAIPAIKTLIDIQFSCRYFNEHFLTVTDVETGQPSGLDLVGITEAL
jgi:hypothetical protein